MFLSGRSPEEPTEQETALAERSVPRVVVFWEGGATTKRLPQEGSLVLGRSLECDVSVDHKSVSRQHAVLHVGRNIAIEDLGSANGTRVRGERLPPRTPVAIAVGDAVELGSTVLVVQESGRSPRVAQASERLPTEEDGEDGVVLIAPAMLDLYRLARRVAKSPINVMVTGETGAGKDVLAHAIHRHSSRAQSPFVAINCAAMPESLLESELFGYEKGAFTGADRAKPGYLEAAHGGTLFLDEVGDMPLATQAKLLRAVEQREVTRLGSVRAIACDVRLVSATNADLDARIRAGAFRADLYFRLNGIALHVPPLRERAAEIVPLAQAFLAAESKSAGRPVPELSPEACRALCTHAWPGNVRELKNVIAHALIFADGARRIELAHFPALAARSTTPSSSREESAEVGGLQGELDAFERARIVAALEQCSGNQTRAAQMLGISRRTLLNRLDAYGLPRPRK